MIHPTAVVDPGARLGESVAVGPYAVIGAGVEIGPGCRIGPHASLEGPLVLGAECEVGPFAALGQPPQVKGNPGPFGAARVGARTVFREYSSLHRSMFPDKATVVGDDGFFMAGAHAAHDCVVGDHVVLCNNVLLAGHVQVGDRAFLAGASAVGQFRRVGELVMLGGHTGSDGDVPPFCMAAGARRPVLTGLNVVGLRRAGYDADARRALQEAYRALFRSGRPLRESLPEIDTSTPAVARLVAFLRAPTKYRIVGLRDG